MQERAAVLVVNTHSRSGKALYDQASATLKELGVELHKSVECEQFPTMLQEVRSAVRDRVPLLIAGGGDGTITAVANEVIGSDTVLAVLPLGTGNAFARDLHIPFEVKAAC